MGWAYSVDLRERVVAAFDRAEMTDQDAAALFKVGEATVRRWKRLRRETGALDPKNRGRLQHHVGAEGEHPALVRTSAPRWRSSHSGAPSVPAALAIPRKFFLSAAQRS
jgi:Helix-turn-helix domain